MQGNLVCPRISYVAKSTHALLLSACTNKKILHMVYICNVVSKGRQRSSILLRGFVSRRPDIMRAAFVTYVRPILEYNSIVEFVSQTTN
jgi:hypothetical protein